MRKKDNQEKLSSIHSDIKNRYKSGDTPYIEPVWETENIKLYPPYKQSWQDEDKERIQLIDKLPVQFLIDYLDEAYIKIFEKQTLFNNRLTDSKVCEIINRWENKLPIDPPILTWDNHKGKILIENGIHRTNTAILMKVSDIPVLTSTNDYLEIHPRYLKSKYYR